MSRRLNQADAAGLCAQVYPTRAAAAEVAGWLRGGGWTVTVLHTPDSPGPRRPDGVRVLAVVTHPQTFESAGEVVYADPD